MLLIFLIGHSASRLEVNDSLPIESKNLLLVIVRSALPHFNRNCFQAFTTPKQLLRKLIQRYNVPRDPNMSMEEFVKYRTGIQNGVINCLKLWVTNGDDFESEFRSVDHIFLCFQLVE